MHLVFSTLKNVGKSKAWELIELPKVIFCMDLEMYSTVHLEMYPTASTTLLTKE